MLKTYFEKTPIPADEKPHGVEVRLEAALSQHGLPTLIGILDLVRPAGTIVDFKTSAQTPDPARVVHQTEIQLTCYGVIYRDATGRKETGFELNHLVKQKAPKLIVTSVPAVTEQQQTRLFRMIESYVNGVDREDFVPSPGLHCASCEFFNDCRRWS
jgi:hypothetical protein